MRDVINGVCRKRFEKHFEQQNGDPKVHAAEKIWKSNYCRIKLVGYSILIIILSHLITPICLFSKVLFLCLCKTMFFFMHHLFFEKSLNGSPKLILIVQWFLNPGTDHT